jgi:hypothetical protein
MTLKYIDIIRLPVTNFLGLICSVLAAFIIYCIKLHEPQTYYFGSVIPFLALLTFIHNITFIYFIFKYGVPIYFAMMSVCILMSIVLNNAFVIVYDYYTVQDTEFIYWKSSRRGIAGVFFTLAYFIDYKIIRLFYSRLNKLDYLSAKFKSFRRIHYPYRSLVIVEFIFVTFPQAGLCVYTIISTQPFIDIWWIALESIIMMFIFSIFKISDLITNKNLNEDFYNQQKDHPDILPYTFIFGSNGKIKIKKRFDFGNTMLSKDDYSFSSRTFLRKNNEDNTAKENKIENTNNEIAAAVNENDISFRIDRVGANFGGNNNNLFGQKFENEKIEIKKFTDDTNLNNSLSDIQFKNKKLSKIRNSLIRTKKAHLAGDPIFNKENHNNECEENGEDVIPKKERNSNNIFSKLSSGIKNMIKLISPNKNKEVSKFNDKEYTKIN